MASSKLRLKRHALCSSTMEVFGPIRCSCIATLGNAPHSTVRWSTTWFVASLALVYHPHVVTSPSFPSFLRVESRSRRACFKPHSGSPLFPRGPLVRIGTVVVRTIASEVLVGERSICDISHSLAAVHYPTNPSEVTCQVSTLDIACSYGSTCCVLSIFSHSHGSLPSHPQASLFLSSPSFRHTCEMHQ